MPICVDPLMPTLKKSKKWKYNNYCHLFSDNNDLGELFEFAESIGLEISWFQDRKFFPHFDLTGSKRELAVKKGAREVSIMEMVDIVKKNREEMKNAK